MQAEPVQVRPFDDSPHEECGVFGVSTPHGDGVAQTVFFGLFALQHRGQEAAGIAVSDGSRVRMHKESGLVTNVFTPAAMASLSGYHGIGHTRYSTMGADAQRNAQPFLVETMHGPLAVARQPGFWHYVQNHVVSRLTDDTPDFDGIGELHFRSADAVQDGMFDSEEGMRLIWEDTERFMDHDGSTTLPAREHLVP